MKSETEMWCAIMNKNCKNETKRELYLPMEIGMPSQLENLALPDPVLVTQYNEINNRILWVQGDIDECVLEVGKQIQMFNVMDAGIPAEDRKPIKLFVFSHGGMDTCAWYLVDAIESSVTPVWTINAGKAMSNGLTVLLAGHKRFTYPHAVAMYHSGSAGLEGTKEQLESAQRYIKNQDKIYEKWFLEKTNISTKLFGTKKKTDWYLTAQEMKELGIVDCIISSLTDIL